MSPPIPPVPRITAPTIPFCLLLLLCALGVAVPPAGAQGDAERQREEQRASRVLEQHEAQREASTQAAEEALAPSATPAPITEANLPAAAILETLKKRAAEAIARRRARRWAIYSSVTLSTTIETNPNLDSSRKGDGNFEEDTDLGMSWRWLKGLTQDAGYRTTNVNYIELRDNNYTDNTFYTTWRYRPVQWFRLTGGYEFTALNYYENRSSSLDSHRAYLQARHYFGKGWYQEAGWDYFYRRYSVRKARDGNGNDTDDARHDTRHTMSYTLAGTVWQTFMSVRQEAHFHFSNDDFQDFYDEQTYKVRVLAARQFWEKWQASGNVSFERKNYTDRQVSTAAAIAEYDNTFSYGLSISYNVSPNVSLQYSFTRRKLDSNTPSSEYTDTTNQFALTASF